MPQVWYDTIAYFLKKLGLERWELDHGVFFSKDRQLFLAPYIDDLLFYDFDKSCLTNIQDQLRELVKMRDLEEISHQLGIEIDVETEKVSLRQTTYIKKIIECF